eukprot:8051523-Pyramimonas_sp.AAC.1
MEDDYWTPPRGGGSQSQGGREPFPDVGANHRVRIVRMQVVRHQQQQQPCWRSTQRSARWARRRRGGTSGSSRRGPQR